MKELICKTESFVKRVRWKVFHLLNSSGKNHDGFNTFGFRTMRTPPKNPLLYEFETDLYEMISRIRFRAVKNEFQNKLRKDLKEITSSEKLYVNADKTRNLYAIKPEEYEKLLKNKVTETYKKCTGKQVEEVNKEAKTIVSKIKLEDRVQVLSEDPSFITIKDHKPNFPRNIECRLLNPSKSQVGKISKNYLEKINSTIRQETNLNQWRNTSEVIKWFNKIPNKECSTFVKFDIVRFYPSITLEVLKKAIKFAERFYAINEDIVTTVLNARKSFLFYKEEPWIKKDNVDHFDVTEGSFDGAEVCELVGLYMLNSLQKLVKTHSVGLYRDDGLMVIQGGTGHQKDKLRKNIEKLFKENGFKITCDINLQSVDFLDVEFNLPLKKYHPYRKPNDVPMYINKKWNHPGHVIKQIPQMTSARLSNLSCNEQEFQKIVPEYQSVLKISVFHEKLMYTQTKRRKGPEKEIYYGTIPPLTCRSKVMLHEIS